MSVRRRRRPVDEHGQRPRDAGVQRARRERETFTSARSIPTDAAAASWSRTAMSERPNRLRTMRYEATKQDDGEDERT